MKTESETIQEATDTVAFIRRLRAEEDGIKESLKEKRGEIQDAMDHLTALFDEEEKEENDAKRPLLDPQEQLEQEVEGEFRKRGMMADQGGIVQKVTAGDDDVVPIRRPRGASKR